MEEQLHVGELERAALRRRAELAEREVQEAEEARVVAEEAAEEAVALATEAVARAVPKPSADAQTNTSPRHAPHRDFSHDANPPARAYSATSAANATSPASSASSGKELELALDEDEEALRNGGRFNALMEQVILASPASVASHSSFATARSGQSHASFYSVAPTDAQTSRAARCGGNAAGSPMSFQSAVSHPQSPRALGLVGLASAASPFGASVAQWRLKKRLAQTLQPAPVKTPEAAARAASSRPPSLAASTPAQHHPLERSFSFSGASPAPQGLVQRAQLRQPLQQRAHPPATERAQSSGH
jgi:hypothetical protein